MTLNEAVKDAKKTIERAGGDPQCTKHVIPPESRQIYVNMRMLMVLAEHCDGEDA